MVTTVVVVRSFTARSRTAAFRTPIAAAIIATTR